LSGDNPSRARLPVCSLRLPLSLFVGILITWLRLTCWCAGGVIRTCNAHIRILVVVSVFTALAHPPFHVFLSSLIARLRCCTIVHPSINARPYSTFALPKTVSSDFSPAVHVVPWTRAIPCTPPFFTYFMVFYRRPRGRCSITYRTNLKSIPRKKKGRACATFTQHPSTSRTIICIDYCHCPLCFLFIYFLTITQYEYEYLPLCAPKYQHLYSNTIQLGRCHPYFHCKRMTHPFCRSF